MNSLNFSTFKHIQHLLFSLIQEFGLYFNLEHYAIGAFVDQLSQYLGPPYIFLGSAVLSD